MGCAIGGAVGVHVANTGKKIAVIAGDGDFFMNGMEILTAKEFHYPIIYFIVNNAMLGFVDHGHQFLFNRVVSEFKQERISIANMLAPCGIRTMEINDIKQMSGITELLKDLDGPAVIELITDGSEASPNGDRLKALSKQD
jgi:acetolactate synthase-1/2/3 large subunit